MNPLELPLVSVIITAHNYARFLRAAVQSVFDQSYASIECIVVDDGSIDETPLVAAELQRDHPSIVSRRNVTALGQGAASRVGFEASHGDYIVFLDGDDVLMPDFVRDHVFTHLSARLVVGFTSSDIYQVVNGRLVVSTYEALSDRLLATPPAPAKRFRPLATAPSGPWTYDGPDPALLSAVRYVRPSNSQWCWSPMTANMFRRDALTLFIGFHGFDQMRLGADAYLCIGVNLLCGSFLIDKPLSIYRIHGGNSATIHAQLRNVRALKPHGEPSAQARRLLIEHLTYNATAMRERLWSPWPLLMALWALDADLGGRDAGCLREYLARNRETMLKAVGEPWLGLWSLGLRLTPRWLRRIRMPTLALPRGAPALDRRRWHRRTKFTPR